jgi:tetratricopeptide (TPR) repeat protein
MMSRFFTRVICALFFAAEESPALCAQQPDKPPESAAQTGVAPASTATKAAMSPVSAPPPSPLAVALQLYRTGKYEAAIERYNSVIKTNTDAVAASAYAGLARVYLKQKTPPMPILLLRRLWN